MFKSDFLNEIDSRGFIYQSSEIKELDELMQLETAELIERRITKYDRIGMWEE